MVSECSDDNVDQKNTSIDKGMIVQTRNTSIDKVMTV